MNLTGYLAPEGLEDSLKSELKNIAAQYGRLFLAEGPPQNVHWVQNVWHNPQTYKFKSLSDAAKYLRSLQKLWAFYPYSQTGKGKLIASQLAYFSPKPLPFPSPLPKTPLGSWMLLDEETLLASPLCSSPFAHGEVHFQENKSPPSRAYLKLWEALTKAEKIPQPNETCLEIGASPGSWTWALQQLNATVYASDRAPLDPKIAALPKVHFLQKDAFSLKPSDFPKLDWIFSDVICYPEKLLRWLEQWLPSKIRFVCTLKFQGTDGYGIVEEFKKIPGSQVSHLYHNKHELVWIKTVDSF